MSSYPRSNVNEPGTWKPLTVGKGRLSASFFCPSCGQRGTLEDHAIADDGTVSPSVVCECGFHEFIRLDGWKAQAQPMLLGEGV